MRVPLGRYPGMNRFVLDWLGGEERATRFLPRDGVVIPSGSEGPGRAGGATSVPPSAQVPRCARDDNRALADALLASNRHWGVFPDLTSWSNGESLTIVAGQQVGFAGGPLYTLAKIATLVRLKRDLEKQGLPVTAFFWLATEDHDFDEVATLNVPVSNQQLDLLCMRAVRTTASRAVVGSLPVPETLITQLLAFYDIPRPNWLREGITFRDSFAELIAGIFGNEIVLVDALLPELRRAGAPLFDAIQTRHDEIQKLLAHRAEEFSKAGYHEQVVPREGNEYTLLFELDENGHRQPPTANRQPEKTSTSALTRPLLQDYVLQPHVFVGGPAEVAYYAQIAPLHELLGVAMPRVALRGHVVVAPKRVARAFDRYGIDPAEIFDSADAILAEHEPEGVVRVQSIAEEAKRDLFARIEQIGAIALPAEHSLARSIERSIGHLEYHFDKLAERAIKGLVRKDRERYVATRELVATLYPDRHVQDRVVSWFAYWCVYGQELIDRVIENVEPDSGVFKIVEL